MTSVTVANQTLYSGGVDTTIKVWQHSWKLKLVVDGTCWNCFEWRLPLVSTYGFLLCNKIHRAFFQQMAMVSMCIVQICAIQCLIARHDLVISFGWQFSVLTQTSRTCLLKFVSFERELLVMWVVCRIAIFAILIFLKTNQNQESTMPYHIPLFRSDCHGFLWFLRVWCMSFLRFFYEMLFLVSQLSPALLKFFSATYERRTHEITSFQGVNSILPFSMRITMLFESISYSRVSILKYYFIKGLIPNRIRTNITLATSTKFLYFSRILTAN